MLDLFMFTDILISYCDNKMTVNYNTILNTVNDLNADDIINRYEIHYSLTDFKERIIIKLYDNDLSIKDNRFRYTLYEIRVSILDEEGNCMIDSVHIRSDD